jgi:hypothetical protein
MPPENDQDRLAFIEDVFEGSTDIVPPWKSLLHRQQEFNGEESRSLDSMKKAHQTRSGVVFSARAEKR